MKEQLPVNPFAFLSEFFARKEVRSAFARFDGAHSFFGRVQEVLDRMRQAALTRKEQRNQELIGTLSSSSAARAHVLDCDRRALAAVSEGG